MAINDISLTAGMKNNLLSLQGTSTLINRTQKSDRSHVVL